MLSTMSGHERVSLKRLLEAVPPGFLVDSAWLERNGIGRRSAYGYVKSGWLDRLERGVFRRRTPEPSAHDRIDWRTCVVSIQHIMGYAVHVGGITALNLHGHGHYLSLGEKATVWL